MKITVDIECTPQELRTFFGMPDLEPMQKAVMDEMQRRMMSAMDQVSPTAVVKDWMAPMTAMQQALFGAFASGMPGATGSAGESRDSGPGGRASGGSRRRPRASDAGSDAGES